MNIYQVFTALAFRFDPEDVHHWTTRLLNMAPWSARVFHYTPRYCHRLSGTCLNWRSPFGIAAGLDKDAEMVSFFDQLGIGALEVGTVTPKPQVGNPRPRIWRRKETNSLRNAMGFPGGGMQAAIEHLQFQKNLGLTLGVNIGKNKITPNDQASKDYEVLAKGLREYADYIAINVSSPNTPGLRELQNADTIKELVQTTVAQANSVPVLVKFSPDQNPAELETSIRAAHAGGAKGIIATNTTSQHDYGAGGLSGQEAASKMRPMQIQALNVAKQLGLDTIAVGGISSFQDVIDLWNSGAKHIQIYTAFIYQGPGIFENWAKQTDSLIEKYNASSLQDLLDNHAGVLKC